MKITWAIIFFLAFTIWMISLSHEREFSQEVCDSPLWFDSTVEMRAIVTCARNQ